MKPVLMAALIFAATSGAALAQSPPIAAPAPAPALNACEQARIDWAATPKPKLTVNSTAREVLDARHIYLRDNWLRSDAECDGVYTLEDWRTNQWNGKLMFDFDGDGRLSKSEYQRSQCGGPQNQVMPSKLSQRMLDSCYRRAGNEFVAVTFLRDKFYTREIDKDSAKDFMRENDQNNDGLITPAEMDETARRMSRWSF